MASPPSFTAEQKEKLKGFLAKHGHTGKPVLSEAYSSGLGCPTVPSLPLTPQLTNVSTGCPSCSSIGNAFKIRTTLDQRMSSFYMSSVIDNPLILTDLLSQKFAY